ncbi:hypothetical protein ACF0H5_006303 [Mactra antiquata]
MRTRVGFAGGSTANPTYRTIGDHTETIDIEFDSSVTNYETILKNFWAWHDPTSSHSRQYMSAIFYHNDEQRKLAEKTKAEHQSEIARPIATVISKAGPFYEAEDYHQKYILRRHSKIIDCLNLTDEELITSYTACRLNGYLGGYGTEESFNEEKDQLDIPNSVVGYIQQQIRKGRRF